MSTNGTHEIKIHLNGKANNELRVKRQPKNERKSLPADVLWKGNI